MAYVCLHADPAPQAGRRALREWTNFMHGIHHRAWRHLKKTAADLSARTAAPPLAVASSLAKAPQSLHQPLLRRAALLILAALAAILAWSWWAGGKKIATVVAVRGSAAEVVYATGVVEPVNWAKVTALQRKRITEICKCEGQTVKKGDVLARLDDIEENAALTEFEARLKRLKDDAARMTTLVQRDITTRTALDEKLTQIQEQEARIAAQKDRIADLLLRSPIDGVVLRRDGEVGEIAGIGNSDTLLWVGQPKPLRIVADVNEDDILKVVGGQSVLLRHEGHSGPPLMATIDRVTPKGDPQTKTFRVYMDLPDDTSLKVGMSVEANIVVQEVKDGILVPTEALGDHMVILVKDGRAALTPVEIGIRGSGRIEVRSGINPGDIVVSPFDKTIVNGMRIDATGGKSP